MLLCFTQCSIGIDCSGLIEPVIPAEPEARAGTQAFEPPIYLSFFNQVQRFEYV